MSMSPKNRAASQQVKAGVHQYFVYDDNVKEIGGVAVIESNGSRVVRLSAGQAQLMLDQGVIGFKAKESLDKGAVDAMKQFRREKFVQEDPNDKIIED